MPNPHDLAFLSIAVILACAIFYSKKRYSRQGLPLPPGPRPLPLIGNLFDHPRKQPWLVYHDWSRKYGEVVSVSVLGQRIVILDSVKAISDLLEKRSAIYSDRARLPMLTELCGWGWNFSFMNYGSKWRERRRIFNQHFSSSAVQSLYPIHNKYSKLLLQHLLQSPDEFGTHLRQKLTASIMESVYAMEIKDRNDPFIEVAEISLSCLSITGTFGTFYVDIFPFLKYVPSWFPGAGFKRQAAEWAKYATALKYDAFAELTDKMSQNVAKTCIAKTMLEGVDPQDEEALRVIQEATGIAFGAGADTSVSASTIFLLAMMLFPEAQQKAQAEIDAVVGRDRLPDFNDRPNLPYVEALCKEFMRWKNVAPLSIAHATSADDVYEGYFIPKGSIIIANTWAVTHDPNVYPEPEKFKPERFLKNDQPNPTVRDPNTLVFGSGRRICPGRYFALNSIYSVASNVLACFSIGPPSDGSKYEPQMSPGIVSFPEPFKATIKPRYEGVEALIENAVIDVQELN